MAYLVFLCSSFRKWKLSAVQRNTQHQSFFIAIEITGLVLMSGGKFWFFGFIVGVIIIFALSKFVNFTQFWHRPLCDDYGTSALRTFQRAAKHSEPDSKGFKRNYVNSEKRNVLEALLGLSLAHPKMSGVEPSHSDLSQGNHIWQLAHWRRFRSRRLPQSSFGPSSA